MKICILSSGVVCPGGLGEQALHNDWPLRRISNAAGSRSFDVGLVDRDNPVLRRWEQEPRIRRASPISLYMMEAAAQALAAVPTLDLGRTGVVVSLFLGCLIYSVRLYKQMRTEGRRFASPILFPETVFNSPTSHLVSALKLGGPVYSQIGDNSCWASSLRTAECWLRTGSADHVLVLGAKEFDAHELDAMQSAGWFRNGLRLGEGAGALLLSTGRGASNASLASVHDGYGFQSKEDAFESAREILESLPNEYPVLSTGIGWTRAIEAKICGKRILSGHEPLPCEAFTATAAWDTIRAMALLDQQQAGGMIVPYWGYSQQSAAALLLKDKPKS
jgi:hypothetical protein